MHTCEYITNEGVELCYLCGHRQESGNEPKPLLTNKEERMLSQNKHIPDSQVREDISDTLEEIRTMEIKQRQAEIGDTRLDEMRRSYYPGQIKERKTFCAQLQYLLFLRSLIR